MFGGVVFWVKYNFSTWCPITFLFTHSLYGNSL